MAIDIKQSERDRTGTPPLNQQQPLDDKYTPSGMTCHILEPRLGTATTEENHSPNSSHSYDTFYFNNWTVNQQQPMSTPTFAQPQFYTSTILPERNSPNNRGSLYQELQCRPSVPQSQYSNPSRYSQEWSGSDLNTHSSSFGWTNRGIVKPSQGNNYSNFSNSSVSGKWQDPNEKGFCPKSMGNSKRPRITFTNKQIVELEKEFQFNK